MLRVQLAAQSIHCLDSENEMKTIPAEQFSSGKCSIIKINLLQYFKNEILTENMGII